MVHVNQRICPGGCNNRIPDHWFVCEDDFERLDEGLKLLYIASCPYVPDVHAEAIGKILHWFRANPSDNRPVAHHGKPRTNQPPRRITIGGWLVKL